MQKLIAMIKGTYSGNKVVAAGTLIVAIYIIGAVTIPYTDIHVSIQGDHSFVFAEGDGDGDGDGDGSSSGSGETSGGGDASGGSTGETSGGGDAAGAPSDTGETSGGGDASGGDNGASEGGDGDGDGDAEPQHVSKPLPTCTLTANPSTIKKGESATLTWTTTNADSIAIDNNIGTVSANGSKSVSPTSDTEYKLAAVGAGGKQICKTTITVKEKEKEQPKPPACPISPKTGRIIVDLGAQMIRSDASAGESETSRKSVTIPMGTYKVTLSSWDGSNERVTYAQPHEQWKAVIANNGGIIATSDASSDLPDFVREAFVTEVVNDELVVSAQGTKVYGKHAFFPDDDSPNSVYPICVSFDPKKDEPKTPEKPACPFNQQAGRIIVNFPEKKLRTDQGAANTRTANVNVTIPSGTYTVSLASWDGYIGRENASQPHEQWSAIVSDGSGVIATSNAIRDLEDNVRESFVSEVVNNENFVVDRNGTIVHALHAFISDTSSANSVIPICAAFDPKPVVIPNEPVCTLDLNPTQIAPGATSTLSWTTDNVTSASINQGIGTVSLDGSTTVNPTADTTYTLTALGDNGKEISCVASLDVNEPPQNGLTCDAFTANPSTINSGQSFSLTWQTTGATNVTIDQGIGNVAVDGSVNTSVTADTTYTLTASNGTNTVQCTTAVDVSTGGGGGGGGGGSSSPRCEFTASEEEINPGDEVELSWDNTRTNDITIIDNRGNIIVDSEEDDDIDEDEGSITVRPTRNTTYTLTAIRGSREDECEVDITMEGVSVSSSRSQEPIVAGISLSSVPYTGFEAGPMLTALFYGLLAAWGIAVAYVLVVRGDSVLGIRVANGGKKSAMPFVAPSVKTEQKQASAVPAYQSYKSAAASAAPVNLPTYDYEPVIGYSSAAQQYVSETKGEVEEAMSALENRAHEKNALLSSDAIRFIIDQTPKLEEQLSMLDLVIEQAKASYPSEDGWVVINRERILSLLS